MKQKKAKINSVGKTRFDNNKTNKAKASRFCGTASGWKGGYVSFQYLGSGPTSLGIKNFFNSSGTILRLHIPGLGQVVTNTDGVRIMSPDRSSK